jgi:hypothetical protein
MGFGLWFVGFGSGCSSVQTGSFQIRSSKRKYAQEPRGESDDMNNG